MENNYFVSAPHGGSGHFLWFYLNDTVYNDTVENWRIDEKIKVVDSNNKTNYYHRYQSKFFNNISNFNQVNGYVKKTKYPNVDYILLVKKTFSHDTKIEDIKKINIRVKPKDYSDYIPIAINRMFKCGELDKNNLTVDLLDKCLITIKNWSIYSRPEDYQTLIKPVKNFNIILNYQNIMSIDDLLSLYESVNNSIVPDYKISYAKSYINMHQKFYNTPFYKCFYAISQFEYNNKLFNCTRTWPIDSLDFSKFENFLEKNLKLENYF